MADNHGEGAAATSVLFRATLTQNFRTVVPEENFVVEEPIHEDSTESGLEDGTTDVDRSDWGYDSPIPYYQEELPESDTETPYGTDVEEARIMERHVDNQVDLGQAIAFAFPVRMDYSMDDEDLIFDDDEFSDDSTESGLSTTHGMDTETILRLAEIGDIDASEEDAEDETSDDNNEDSSEEEGMQDADDESYSDESSKEDNDEEEEASLVPNNSNSGPAGPATDPVTQPLAATLQEIQRARFSVDSHEEFRDRKFEEMRVLQESLRAIVRELVQVAEISNQAQQDVQDQRDHFDRALLASGVSPELFDAYQSFCESLYWDHGEMEGFSITCFQPHDGSYVTYDPTFQIFKDNVEIDYHTFNYKAEPSVLGSVNFWPVKAPSVVEAGRTDTWSTQHPELYQLAFQAARNGSETAMEMLINLPDLDAATSGWLFEFRKGNDSPIISRQWVFRSAHNVDQPATVEEKRQRIQDIILAGGCPNCGWTFARP